MEELRKKKADEETRRLELVAKLEAEEEEKKRLESEAEQKSEEEKKVDDESKPTTGTVTEKASGESEGTPAFDEALKSDLLVKDGIPKAPTEEIDANDATVKATGRTQVPSPKVDNQTISKVNSKDETNAELAAQQACCGCAMM